MVILGLTLTALLTAPATPATRPAGDGGWAPAEAPLMSTFAADVDPADPLPEYPRPQLRRDRWQSLNGLWQFAHGESLDDMPAAGEMDRQILVPFPVESALSGIGEPATIVWYRRAFDTPEMNDGERLLLHFGAVDFEAHVHVNGQKVGEHRGGYDPFTFDITDALDAGGDNELVVGVRDETSPKYPRGKQDEQPHGIVYTPATGIWQTVWLEPVPAARVAGLKITPDVEAGEVQVEVTTAGGSDRPDGGRYEFVVTDGGREIARRDGPGGVVRLKVPDAELWSPADPHLYDLTVRYNGDEVASYFGMRSIGLGRDEESGKVTSITLNGRPLFQVGPLDQGYWPDGNYTAPTDEALRYDIEVARDLGFNMIRKHVKIEPARWYYHADTLGVLVWQDMPSAWAVGDDITPESRAQFEKELRAMIDHLGDHPSVVMWVVFNEGWGQHDTERLTALVKELDPTRLASNASGWVDQDTGDVVDMHQYPGPGMHPTEPDRASVLGEFGGIGLAVRDHLWQEDELFQYRGAADSEKLTADYEDLMRRVWALREDGLAAAVYTQTTDVEGEINGLLTYDRAVIKPDAGRVRAANLGDIDLRTSEAIVLTARSRPEDPPAWRYTFEKPAGDWYAEGFDASSWAEGEAGFGTPETPASVVNTTWDGDQIWVRREIDVPADALDGDGKLAWTVHHDEDVTLYLNGRKVLEREGHVSSYTDYELDDAARAALRPGRNVLAAHCRQTVGGQYLDVGLSRLIESPNPRPREDAAAFRR